MARKYGKKAQSKVKRAMHERKRGTLKSGSGRTVKNRKQAIAIGLSEAREAGGKVPKRKSGTLRSGQSGKKVTSRKQAIAIGLSEARREGGKVPDKRGGAKKRKKKT